MGWVGTLPPSVYIFPMKQIYMENKKKYDGFKIAENCFWIFLSLYMECFLKTAHYLRLSVSRSGSGSGSVSCTFDAG